MRTEVSHRSGPWYVQRLMPLVTFVVSLTGLFAAFLLSSPAGIEDSLDMSKSHHLIVCFLILLTSSLIWLFVTQLARLNQSRENLRLTIESSTDIVVLLDEHARYVDVFSAESAKLIGPPDQIIGRSIRDVMGAELGGRVEKAVTEVLRTGEKAHVGYSLNLNGRQLWFEAILSKRDAATVVAMIRDMTREKHLSLELEEQRRFMEKILNSISDPIFMKNAEHQWLYGNDAFCTILGRSREDYYGKTDDAIFPAEIAKAFFESDDQTFAAMSEFETEEVILGPGGESRTILTKKTPFVDPGGKRTLVGIIRDITERKQMERQLSDERARQVAASRLASLGEMAGGVAHEINNPLAIISGYTGRLTDIISVEPFARERAQEIVSRLDATTTRIATIVKGLRAISRDGGHDPKVSASVEDIIADTLGLCSEKFRNSGVSLETEIEKGLKAYCRNVQISQVLLNLLTNAFFAVSKHPNAKITVVARTVGEFAEISVVDSGTGVDDSLRERIFEPFFTTKPVGIGTGLGLSIAASIVREHEGELFLDPTSPATRFVMRIPTRKMV
jgi:PAS domain S-box-containing protein